MQLKKIDKMYYKFGRLDTGQKCKDCSNYQRVLYNDKHLRKCGVYGFTHSESSDWVGKWDACGQFNKKWDGIDIIRINVGFKDREQEIEQIEGQQSLID